MSKIQFTYDPVAQAYAQKLTAQADKISGLASQYDTHSGLTDLGKSELGNISSGNYGSTMLGGVARNQAARDIQSAKDSQGLGTAAMRTGANNPNSLLSHSRLLKRATNETNNRASDQLVRALPGYASEVGGWANTDNALRSQRIAAEQGVSSALSGAAQASSAGTVAREKKSFWDNLWDKTMQAAGAVGSLASGFAKSDERTKQDIKPVTDTDATKKIKKLKVKKFQYKPGLGEAEGERTGVMAQEVEKVEPKAVRTRDDGVKEVNYRDLFATNIGATKDLISRVEKLEAKKKEKK